MSEQRNIKQVQACDGSCPLGAFLEDSRKPETVRVWRILMFAALALICLISLFVPNEHPHFGLDKYPLFWPVFGFTVGVLMVFVVKKIVQPFIKRPEDYYNDL